MVRGAMRPLMVRGDLQAFVSDLLGERCSPNLQFLCGDVEHEGIEAGMEENEAARWKAGEGCALEFPHHLSSERLLTLGGRLTGTSQSTSLSRMWRTEFGRACRRGSIW